MANTTETYEDRVIMEALLTRDSSSIGNAFIDDAITQLKAYAFAGFTDLDVIRLPKVTAIGTGAFFRTEVGTTFDLAWSRITRIGTAAFMSSDCIKESTLVLSACRTVGKNAFRGEQHVTNVTLPVWLGDTTYDNEYPAELSRAGDANNGLDGPFRGSSIQTISAPEATSIVACCFMDCKSLISASMPKVETIFNDAFNGCLALTEFICDTARTLNASAFYNCTALVTVRLPNVESLSGNYIFQNCTNLVTLDLSSVTSLAGSGTFTQCRSLTSLTMQFGSLTAIPQGTFQHCDSLAGNYVFANVTSVSTYAFQYCGMTSISLPKATVFSGSYIFQYCKAETLSIPQLTSVGATSFCDGMSNLKSVALDSLVSVTAQNCFRNCTSLESLSLPELTTISGNAFCDGCSELKTANLPKLSSLTGTYAFRGCALTSFSNTGLTELSAASSWANCSSMRSISFSNVTQITAASMFSHCSALATIQMPKLETITASYSFEYCTSLASVTFPKLATITKSTGMFRYCTSLATVVFEADIDAIPSSCFTGDSLLKTLVFSGITKVPPLGSGAFSSCALLTNRTAKIYVPANLVSSFQEASGWSTYKTCIEDVANYTP